MIDGFVEAVILFYVSLCNMLNCNGKNCSKRLTMLTFKMRNMPLWMHLGNLDVVEFA